MLDHSVILRGIKVDKMKIEVIEKFEFPMDIKGVRSFLEHCRFCRRFIENFSLIVKPLMNLLMKDLKLVFMKEYADAFNELKKTLISALILQPSDWSQPFEFADERPRARFPKECAEIFNELK
jgi:hypothetical protein